MKWLNKLPVDLIEKYCKAYNVPFNIMCAIISVESNGEQYACRYEPGYKWTFNTFSFASDLKITPATESIMQSISYGYTQTMGANFRAMGFSGYLGEVFDADLNISYGCKFMRTLIEKHINFEDAIASYNAGSPRKTPGGFYVNQVYVDKVCGKIRELEQEQLEGNKNG